MASKFFGWKVEEGHGRGGSKSGKAGTIRKWSPAHRPTAPRAPGGPLSTIGSHIKLWETIAYNTICNLVHRSKPLLWFA